MWKDDAGRVFKLSELSNQICCVENPARDRKEHTVEMYLRPAKVTPRARRRVHPRASHSTAKGTKYENFMAMLDEYDRLKDKF